jgi:hypothetical protein
MGTLFDWITDWIEETLRGGIITNFTGLFDAVNAKTGEIASQIGQTPGDFNPGVFAMIRNLSDTVIIPIAGIILTFILCYEFISMIIDQNNLSNIDTWIFFKWIFKSFVAITILTHTFDIVMSVFEIGQSIVNDSAGIISGSLDMELMLTDLEAQLEAMELGELLGLYLESTVIKLLIEALALCVFIIIYGRMIEIYLTISLAPIPLATMANREWGQMGNNYLKSLFALAFQGFLIMVCVGIYAALLQGITASANIHIAIWTTVGYTALLCLSMFKTGTLAKSVMNSH